MEKTLKYVKLFIKSDNIKHYKPLNSDKFNMCLAIPGKVIEIGKDIFVVDYRSEKREAIMSLVDIKVGDYVIISNRIIVNKVPEEQAEKYLEIVNNARKENGRKL